MSFFVVVQVLGHSYQLSWVQTVLIYYVSTLDVFAHIIFLILAPLFFIKNQDNKGCLK